MSSPHEKAIDAHSHTALASTKRNLRYLYNPSTTSSAASPSRRTRALLRVLRSTALFAFWRLVRYAKYIAMGTLVATVGAGALGTAVSGVGFVVAPTGIVGTVVAGLFWGVGRFAVGRVRRRWGLDEEEDEELWEREERRRERMERGAEGMPW